MKFKDLRVSKELVDILDDVLMEYLQKCSFELSKSKKYFSKAKKEYNAYNYVGYVTAKLYYYFAKEEYKKVLNEAQRRGLADKSSTFVEKKI